MPSVLAPDLDLAAPAQGPWSKLNEQQLEAVQHGVGQPSAPALLVVAGAGSGKTMTLAARVARLVLAGADPQRLLLLTFSRRAAQEMERRAGQLLQQALGQTSTRRPPELPWAGTFHAIGARLLREYAARVGLSEQFTVLDRGDAEDLMGWLREEQGLGRTHKRFPLKGTCLAIYSRAVNSEERLVDVLQLRYPWCAEWAAELKGLFRAYVSAKQAQRVLDYDLVRGKPRPLYLSARGPARVARAASGPVDEARA